VRTAFVERDGHAKVPGTHNEGGTVLGAWLNNQTAHGHGVRHCRYCGQPKAHLRHVLTAIAVNIERLSSRSVTEEASPPRPPTAFQTFLDQQRIPRSKSWRTPGS
jgi:hypothetical protein